MAESIIVEPDPKRMIEGLRDTGYSFNTAVADLIDNSIAAEADKIHVLVNMDFGGGISVMIADNGYGMSRDDLISAMKYGSPPRRNPRSLGKFGLGMKTASTAFCRRFSVISRMSGKKKLVKATWDLDHVAEVGQWELVLSEPTEDEVKYLNKTAGNGSGTLVSWEKVDRVLKEYANPGGARSQAALKSLTKRLEAHIRMVFQRFLNTKDAREKQKTIIWVNNTKLTPWDPFCEKEGRPVQKETVTVAPDDGGKPLGKFSVRAFVLPRREEFSTEEAANEADISNDLQGFYVYRENRLIHYADWMGMYTQEPHFSLLRVEFSFDSDLDEAFQVDIKKSRISLNNDLYRWLKDEFLPPVRRAAENRYRKGQKKAISRAAIGAHDSSNRNIENKEAEIEQAQIKVVDRNKGEVQLTNEGGTTKMVMKIEPHPKKPGEFFIQPVDSIDDGLLWQPVLIESHQGVQINKGHSFYHKVYVPNIIMKEAPVGTVQGIDALLWALSIAELKTINPGTKDHFNELRYEVSRILRKVVEELPEPPESNSNDN